MFDELDFALDAKEIDDAGNIEGLAVGYGNVDHGGDQVMPGAIKGLHAIKALPMLLFHDQKRPVGVWSQFRETSEGLSVKGRFSMSTRAGQEAHGMARDGALAGLSMGYRTIRQRFEGKARQLLELALHEVSLVSIPMNDKTRVTSVKEIADLKDRVAAGERLTDREWEALLRKGFDLSNAEAERAVRINLKGRGDPGNTADGATFLGRLSAELRGETQS
jgi:HK97 family phage prohead protease